MANHTQGIILEAFESMLDRMPFEKITVTALIRECNIGRSTFYYHYEDIFALLDAALLKELGRYKEAAQDKNWQEVLKALLYACRANKKRVYHIFNSLSRERLEHYFFEQTESTISAYILRMAEQRRAAPERTQIITDIVVYAVYGYFLRFLRDDMEDDIEASVNKLGAVFDELLDRMLH